MFLHICNSHFGNQLVGNKPKRRISKGVFQENKARQIWRALFSRNTRFEIGPFASDGLRDSKLTHFIAQCSISIVCTEM